MTRRVRISHLARHDPRRAEHELREALRLGRHRVGVEHDCGVCAVEFDIMSDAAFADPGSLSEQELRDLIDRFAAREHVVSYERRMLHGRMDLLRAELVGRLRLRYRTPGSRDAGNTMS